MRVSEAYKNSLIRLIGDMFTASELRETLEDLGFRVSSKARKRELVVELINILKQNGAERGLLELLEKTPEDNLIAYLQEEGITIDKNTRKSEIIGKMLYYADIMDTTDTEKLDKLSVDHITGILQAFNIVVGRIMIGDRRVSEIQARDEEEFEHQILVFLKGRLSAENPGLLKHLKKEKFLKKRGRARYRIDIAISNQVGIEIKVLRRLSELQRLWGQVEVYKEYFNDIIVVLGIPISKTSIRDDPKFKNWVKKLRAKKVKVLIFYVNTGSKRKKGKKKK